MSGVSRHANRVFLGFKLACKTCFLSNSAMFPIYRLFGEINLFGNYGNSVAVKFSLTLEFRRCGELSEFSGKYFSIFGLSPLTTVGVLSKQDQRRGAIFGLIVHVLPGPNKQRAFEPRILLS